MLPVGYPSGVWQGELSSIRLTVGAGCLEALGETARGLGVQRALVVSDPGVCAAGDHVPRALASLAAAGIESALFDGAASNPTTEHVAAGVEAAREHRCDLLVGLGGGSAMDCAKGINFLLTNGGAMADYWGLGKATRPMLPSIGVPTTAGTGSEAQSYALITDPVSHRKMACGDRKARFHAVLLDPDLTTTAPRFVAASAGIDALSHAVESAVTSRGTPVSSLFAREAWSLLHRAFLPALDGDAKARELMLVGAHFAGAAIEASMLGATHAAANPLTARFGTVHGVAIGILLPHVVRFNAEVVAPRYRWMMDLGIHEGGPAGEVLSDRLEHLRRQAGLPGRLQEIGVERAALPALARRACDEWTGKFNPRPVTEADFLELYEAAF
jgi:alcohol dehydrogenase